MPTLITKDNLAANTITAEKLASTVALGGPKISSLDYPGDDTAALPAGGQTVTINGAGFVSGATVYLDGAVVSPVTFNNANSISFTAPAKSANSYVLYVINPDGATAIAIPGLTYSGVPTWTTSAGSLGAVYEANSFSVNLQATGDGNVVFAVSSGNTIPSGLTLSANGLLTGTVPATEANTTYTFYVDAIDEQNQETSRTFSITYNRDTVTWSSPANGAAYSLNTGAANTISLEANSSAGRSITYTVQSGSLPANVSISGANVTGTPNTGQNNTSVVIRATAASTNRFADRTLWFTIISGPSLGDSYQGGYFAGQISTSLDGVATHNLILSPASTGTGYGKQWKTDNSSTSGTSSLYDGPSNSAAMNDSSHPAAKFCEDLTIGGYTDWYLPSLYELAICYYNLKPSAALNLTSIGVNPAAVPPRGSNYSEGTPAQTALAAFQEGGAQAFGATEYWTSSQYSSNDAWWINFTNGNQVAAYGKTNTMRVRAIRRVPV